MSVQAISWVLEHSKSEGRTRCVLISIANHVGPDCEGWCFVDQVLKEAHCTEKTYLRAVRWAIDNGELERDVNKGSAHRAAGNRKPNLFRLGPAVLGMPELPPEETCPRSSVHPKTEVLSTPEPVRAGSSVHPEPLEQLEPPKEPSTSVVIAASVLPKSKIGSDEDEDFAAFWFAYPCKKGKGQARVKWRAAVLDKRVPPQVLIAAARTYAKSRLGQNPKYTAHPATWLNGERWLDEPELTTEEPDGFAAIRRVLGVAT